MKSIENSADILNGLLVFKGTRVPVRNLFDYLLAGESIKDFLEDFPTVSFEQIRYILQSAEVALQSEKVAQMKIIIDECLPKRLTRFFEKDSAYTVPQIGLSGSTDSELLEELDRREVDIFITIDGNIEYC